MSKNVYGSITTITGPMRCGKSEDLQRRVKRFRIADRNVLVFKPNIDNMFSEDEVVSRDGRRTDCIVVPADDPSYIFSFINRSSDVIAIDEAQFFTKRPSFQDCPDSDPTWCDSQCGQCPYGYSKKNIVDVVQELSDRGHVVIIAGLDMTSERKPFGYMPELLAISDEVIKLKAVCEKCKEEIAIYTSAKFDKEQDIVIGNEPYDVLCGSCWIEENK